MTLRAQASPLTPAWTAGPARWFAPGARLRHGLSCRAGRRGPRRVYRHGLQRSAAGRSITVAGRRRLPAPALQRHAANLPMSAPSRSGSPAPRCPPWSRRSKAARAGQAHLRAAGPGHHGHQQDEPEPPRRAAAAPAGQDPRQRRQLCQGARVVRQFLVDAGVDDNDFFFYDGSGMSPDDRIAPRAYDATAGLRRAPAVGRCLAGHPAHRRR